MLTVPNDEPPGPSRAAVIFDLDGTLTRPFLDFDRIRAEIGLASGPILEAVQVMDGDRARRAMEIVERHERDAAEQSQLYEAAKETLDQLRALRLGLAILTRNARRWVDVILARHALAVDAIRTRDDGAIKPSAAPILDICRELGADPRRSWMVGDFKFDVQSGRAAGAGTILMIGDGPVPDYADLADHVIRRLAEIPAIVGKK